MFKPFIASMMITASAIMMAVAFQNCAKARFDANDSLTNAKATVSSAGNDATFSIPYPSSSGSSGNDTTSSSTPSTPSAPSAPTSPSMTTSTPTSNQNTQTTTITTSGSGSCPKASSGPNLSINVSTGSNSQVSNFGNGTSYSMKVAEAPRSSLPCENLDLADIQLQLNQLVVGDNVIASLGSQVLTKDSIISFVADVSISDVDRISLVLDKSGHQFMNSKSEVQPMALQDSAKRRLSVALAQRTSFEKGRSYQLSLKLSPASSIEDEGAQQCSLRPVIEIQ